MPFRIPSASNFMNHIPKSSESQKLQDTCPVTFKEWRRVGIAQADSSIFPGELHYSSVSLSWEGCWTLRDCNTDSSTPVSLLSFTASCFTAALPMSYLAWEAYLNRVQNLRGSRATESLPCSASPPQAQVLKVC